MTTIYTTDSMGIYKDSIEVDPYGKIPKRSTTTPPPESEGYAQLNGGQWEMLVEYPSPAPAIVPQVVAMSQARKALILSGVSIASVDSAIAGIADATEKELAQTDWEYSTTVRRQSPLVTSLGPILGLSESQIDGLFILADTL